MHIDECGGVIGRAAARARCAGIVASISMQACFAARAMSAASYNDRVLCHFRSRSSVGQTARTFLRPYNIHWLKQPEKLSLLECVFRDLDGACHFRACAEDKKKRSCSSTIIGLSRLFSRWNSDAASQGYPLAAGSSRRASSPQPTVKLRSNALCRPRAPFRTEGRNPRSCVV